MLNLPKETEVNKMVAKNKFYEKANISTSLKESFVNDIEKIVWANKLAPSTLNISGSDNIKELEVFHIKLKTGKFNQKVLEAIDKAIPYYILFVLEYNGKYQLWLGYKEKTAGGANKASIVRYFNSEWAKEPSIVLQGNKLDSIYENFLSQLSDNLIDTASEQDIKEKVNKTVEIQKLENQIEKNVEQKQVLTDLMTSVKLSPALFHKVSNELNTEAEMLSKKKEGLLYSMSGEYSKVEELKLLMQFTAKNNMVTEFTEELFLAYVDRVTVVSRAEVMFELKCGLNLKERLVK